MLELGLGNADPQVVEEPSEHKRESEDEGSQSDSKDEEALQKVGDSKMQLIAAASKVPTGKIKFVRFAISFMQSV